jgi:hypothetical protein
LNSSLLSIISEKEAEMGLMKKMLVDGHMEDLKELVIVKEVVHSKDKKIRDM